MLAVLDEAFTGTLDGHFTEDLDESSPIAAKGWARRSVAQRL